jgi:hypothetical protein
MQSRRDPCAARKERSCLTNSTFIRIKDGNIEIDAPGKVGPKGKCLISAPGAVLSLKFELPQGDGVGRRDDRSRVYSD